MNELIVVEKLNPAEIFENGGMGRILEDIKIKVDGLVFDMESEAGRKECASTAYRVARSKTLLDDMGKARGNDLKKKLDVINGSRKTARDFLNNLKSTVRAPLDEWLAEEAKQQEEADRIEREKIQAQVAELQKYGVVKPFIEIATLSEAEYQEILDKSIAEYEAEQERLAKEKAEREAEEKRLADQKAEQERIAKEQADKEAALQVAQDKIEREKQAIEDAKKAEQIRKDREAFEKQAAEEARIKAEKDAKEKAEREAKEAKEREEREAAELARQEALKPDKEKLLNWFDELHELVPPVLTNPEAIEIREAVIDGFGQVVLFYYEKVEKL